MKSYENHQKQRERLAGKRVVGIDPGKEKHQACGKDIPPGHLQ